MLSKLYIIALLLILAQTNACQSRNKNKTQEIFNVNKKVELVYFFKKDVSSDDKKSFLQEFADKFLLIPTREGYIPGEVVKADFGIDKNGYKGFGIRFEPDAKKEQKEEVKNYIMKSPLIFRIYQDVVPNEIDDLPGFTN